MGAWGYRAFQSDGALDWIGSRIEDPIALTIRKELRDFLDRPVRPRTIWRMVPGPWVKRGKGKIQESKPAGKKLILPGRKKGHDVAEAAAGLLDNLTPLHREHRKRVAEEKGLLSPSPFTPTGVQIDLHYKADRWKLYSLAIRALREIVKDRAYIVCWTNPQAKQQELSRLIASLEAKLPYEHGRRPISRRERAHGGRRARHRGWRK